MSQENTDFEIMCSALCNAYFSGVSFESVIEALKVVETPQQFDDAISGSVFVQDVMKNKTQRNTNMPAESLEREAIVKNMVYDFLRMMGFSQFYREDTWLLSGMSDRAAVDTRTALDSALHSYSKKIDEPDLLFNTMSSAKKFLATLKNGENNVVK